MVAGAGSGKTRVLTHRIAHLIQDQGVSPFEILAITFTNKAADEMKHRVGALVGPVAEKMWVSTFHSACVRILRRDATASATRRRSRSTTRPTPSPHRLRDPRPRPRPQEVPAPLRARHHHRRPRTTASAPRVRGRAQRSSSARSPTSSASTRPGCSRPAPWTSTTSSQHGRAAPRATRRARHYQRASSTSWSTSTRTPTASRTRSSSCSRPEHRNVCVVGDGDQCLPPDTVVTTPDRRGADRAAPGG